MTIYNLNPLINSSSRLVLFSLIWISAPIDAFIVESLLIEKPDNPIGFIVEFLHEEGDVICRQGDAGRNFFPADFRKAIGRFKLLYNKARFGGLHPSGCSG